MGLDCTLLYISFLPEQIVVFFGDSKQDVLYQHFSTGW